MLFETDATPNVDNYLQQVFGDALYEIYDRFLETDDEYFDYAPGESSATGSVAHLRTSSARRQFAKGLQRECDAGAGASLKLRRSEDVSWPGRVCQKRMWRCVRYMRFDQNACYMHALQDVCFPGEGCCYLG